MLINVADCKTKKKMPITRCDKKKPDVFCHGRRSLLRKSHHLKLNNHDTQGSRSFISASFGRDSFPSFCRASGFSFPCSSGAKERAAEKEKEKGRVRERKTEREKYIERAGAGRTSPLKNASAGHDDFRNHFSKCLPVPRGG